MTESAHNTSLPQPTPSIEDATGVMWTLGPAPTGLTGLSIYRNGVQVPYTQNVTLLLYFNHVIYQQNAAGGWWSWNGTSFVAASDPRVASTPVPAPTPLPSGMWPATKFSTGTVRGFGVGDKSSISMAALKATGANVARIFIKGTRSGDTYTYSTAALDALIPLAAQYQFKIVPVFEPLPNQAAQEYWAYAPLRTAIINVWRAMATRYRGNTAIAGFDLINEPIAPGANFGQTQWLAFATEIISAIRAIDPARVCIFEPSPGGLPMGFPYTTALPFDNIVYSPHIYQPHEFTHQGLYGYQTIYAYPATNLPNFVGGMAALLQPVKDFVARTGKPIYVGEFSAARWIKNGSAHNYIVDATDRFEAEKWAWSYHAWREYQGWDAELPDSFWSQFPYSGPKPVGFESVNAAAVRTSSTPTMLFLKTYLAKNTA